MSSTVITGHLWRTTKDFLCKTNVKLCDYIDENNLTKYFLPSEILSLLQYSQTSQNSQILLTRPLLTPLIQLPYNRYSIRRPPV